MVVQVAPAQICKLPAPSLKIVSTSLLALAEASVVEAVVLVKFEVVTLVPWWWAMVTVVLTAPTVTVPEMAGSEPMVTELPTVTDEMLTGTVPLIDAVTEPICAVPAPIVTVPPPIVTTPIRFVPVGREEPMVTVPEMGRGLFCESTFLNSRLVASKYPICTAEVKISPLSPAKLGRLRFAVTVPAIV